MAFPKKKINKSNVSFAKLGDILIAKIDFIIVYYGMYKTN